MTFQSTGTRWAAQDRLAEQYGVAHTYAVARAIHDEIFRLAEAGHLEVIRDPDWLAWEIATGRLHRSPAS